jgi:hypothetical protein
VGILSSDEAPHRVLEKAVIAFETGEYGMALRLAEEAKQNKRREYNWFVQTLTDAMKPYQVQQAGDDIPAVLTALESRDAHDAVEIIRMFVSMYSVDFFHNHVSEITAYIKKMNVFPEADFLIGNVYFYESELLLAREYYTRSWEQSYALDTFDQKYDILYQISDLAKMLGDDELFEQSLLLVLADDPYYNNEAIVSLGMETGNTFYDSIKRALGRGYSVDRIFEMYRVNEYRSLRAYIALAGFYRDAGLTEQFLKNAVLGSFTAFTRMYAIVAERNVGYEYRGVNDFFVQALRYHDVSSWSLELGVWECFYYLFEATGGIKTNGEASTPLANNFSQELLTILVNTSPDISVRELARNTELKSRRERNPLPQTSQGTR